MKLIINNNKNNIDLSKNSIIVLKIKYKEELTNMKDEVK